MSAITRLAFALAVALCLSTGAAVAAPHAIQYTLANGLQIVVIPDHRAPVVTHMLFYRVGGTDDPMGHSGLAHFFEHMMFRGTKAVPDNGLSLTVARNGGQDNAFTTHDYTAFYERIAKDRLPLVMGLEADRMVNLVSPTRGWTPSAVRCSKSACGASTAIRHRACERTDGGGALSVASLWAAGDRLDGRDQAHRSRGGDCVLRAPLRAQQRHPDRRRRRRAGRSARARRGKVRPRAAPRGGAARRSGCAAAARRKRAWRSRIPTPSCPR